MARPVRSRVFALPPGIRMDDLEFEDSREAKKLLKKADQRRREKAARLGHRIAKEFRLRAWWEWLRAGRKIYGEMPNDVLTDLVMKRRSLMAATKKELEEQEKWRQSCEEDAKKLVERDLREHPKGK
jgi:hypothetical protein